MDRSDRDDNTPGAASVELTEPERRLLLKACQQLRNSIPVYIQSGERERAAVDALIKKLTS